jgi:hypothetical protein
MSIVQTIEAEARHNSAFRMAVLGAMLTVIGSLIMGAFLLLSSKPKPLVIVILAINLIVTAVAMALAVYTNYCIKHGGCDTLATVYGVVYLVSGILSVVAAVMGGTVTGGLRGARA